MPPREELRQTILETVRKHHPAGLRELTAAIRKENVGMEDVRDADVRAIVQPMIITGKLSYAPGLKIQLGKQ